MQHHHQQQHTCRYGKGDSKSSSPQLPRGLLTVRCTQTPIRQQGETGLMCRAAVRSLQALVVRHCCGCRRRKRCSAGRRCQTSARLTQQHGWSVSQRTDRCDKGFLGSVIRWQWTRACAGVKCHQREQEHSTCGSATLQAALTSVSARLCWLVVQVALVSLETFAVVPLPAARGAAAVCAQPSSHLPVLLGVALRAGKGRSKVALFSVLPGATTTGSSKEPAVMVFQVCRVLLLLGLLVVAGDRVCLGFQGFAFQSTEMARVNAPCHGRCGAVVIPSRMARAFVGNHACLSVWEYSFFGFLTCLCRSPSLQQSQAWLGRAVPCCVLCREATMSCALRGTARHSTGWRRPQQQRQQARLVACSTN